MDHPASGAGLLSEDRVWSAKRAAESKAKMAMQLRHGRFLSFRRHACLLVTGVIKLPGAQSYTGASSAEVCFCTFHQRLLIEATGSPPILPPPSLQCCQIGLAVNVPEYSTCDRTTMFAVRL